MHSVCFHDSKRVLEFIWIVAADVISRRHFKDKYWQDKGLLFV